MKQGTVLEILNYLEEQVGIEKRASDHSESDYMQKGRYLATIQIRNNVLTIVRGSLDAGK